MKASDIRKGVVIYYEGNPCRVMDFQHRTPGNLRAFVQVRMRNLKTGNSFETRFASTEDLQTAQLETKEMQVLYDDGSDLHVMDAQTYDQFTLDNETVGELRAWMQPEMRFQAEWLEGRPIGLKLPSSIDLEITDTAPVMKTATKTASTKPATLINGVTIQVPEFLGPGEKVRVNPNTGEYLERAK
ncbi:MAG: elongation factor P [Vicinamibacterales bacterium]|jgi:elongation factor P|nr:elongation factor P [Vicinamibacterales bacterium]